MSHEHDHPHAHGPGDAGEHDHDHDHDHDHPHEHGHSHDPAPGATPPELPLDPGSQALAEALKSSFGIVKVVMVLLLGVFLFSGFFTVDQKERAIILRLGRPVGEGQKALLGPGLHFAWPYPIDEVVKVPITEVQRTTSTVGWFFVTPEQELAGTDPYPAPSLNPAVDGYLVTADQNIVHSRATLNYRIERPIDFVFNFTAASNAVQAALNTALVQSASHFKVDDILTRDVFGFKDAVKRRTEELLDAQQLGVIVEQLEVVSRPPLFLKADFARVTDAAQKRDTLVNEARTYQNQTLSKAGADAASITNAAESQRAWYVEGLKAEASRFNDLLPKYRENPQLFVQLRLTETMGRVMAGLQDKVYLSESPDGKARELRLLLNREPQKINREQPKP
jgi:membrane protease subunit HflK